MWGLVLSFVFPLWSKFKEYILAAGAAVALIAGVYIKGRLDEKSSLNTKAAKQHTADLETARKIDENVDHMSDTDVDRELSQFVRHK